MSHVVGAADFPILDLECLAAAGKVCGLDFMTGQQTYKWFGKWQKDYHGADAAYKNGIQPENYGKCLHALKVAGQPNAYEVGVVANPKGPGYCLIWDNWAKGHGLMQKIGQDGNKLRQNYAAMVLQKAATKAGHRTTLKQVGDSIHIKAEV